MFRLNRTEERCTYTSQGPERLIQTLRISSVEMIRDGGSLAITFQADDACLYSLTLPILEWKPKTYSEPILHNLTTSFYRTLPLRSALIWFNRLAALAVLSPMWSMQHRHGEETLLSMDRIIRDKILEAESAYIFNL